MTEQDAKETGTFSPFYEWLPGRFPIPFIIKIMLAGAVGFLFLIPRYLVVGDQIIADWSWLLCVIITTALICLYYATHTFRAMFRQLNLRLPKGKARPSFRAERSDRVDSSRPQRRNVTRE